MTTIERMRRLHHRGMDNEGWQFGKGSAYSQESEAVQDQDYETHQSRTMILISRWLVLAILYLSGRICDLKLSELLKTAKSPNARE